MALSIHALTTYATVKAELGDLVPDDDTRRTQIERMISAASRAISTYLSRPLYYQAGIVEDLEGLGGFRAIVRRTPLKRIHAINILNPDQSVAYTFDASTYQIEDGGRTGIIYRTSGAYGLTAGYSVGAANVWGRMMGWPWLAQPGDDIRGSPQASTERPAIQVIYDAGWVTPQQGLSPAGDDLGTRDLPEDIEEACIISVCDMVGRRGRPRTVQTETVSTGQTTFRSPTGQGPFSVLPAECLALVQPYRRLI